MKSTLSRRATLVVKILAPAILLLAGGGGASQAGDVKAGRAKAMMCQACHGLDGLAKTPDAPNIAGQTEAYLTIQLQAFKTGVRKNDAMSVVTPQLSDQDIEDLAAYYAAIEIAIVKIPGE
jgi:cytochrome c553